MKPQFHITYEIVTPESAEHGDAAELGYAMPGGWQFELDSMTPEDIEACALDLRQAVGMMSSCEDSGRWFTETDSDPDYSTGAETRRSLHCPDSITGASYRRVARLLGIRRGGAR